MLVVDASGIVALLTSHPARHELAEALRRDPEAVAPAHLDVEVMSALRGRMLGGHMTIDDLHSGVQALVAMPVRRVPLDSSPLLGEALRWVHNLSAYDGVYLALASLTNGVLLTGDSALAAAAGRARIPHRHVDCSSH
jgi:predicted nucleic acid-binding protein